MFFNLPRHIEPTWLYIKNLTVFVKNVVFILKNLNTSITVSFRFTGYLTKVKVVLR